MATHLFTLVLGAEVPFNDDVAERVCVEVGDDTLCGMCNTAAYIDFRREADSFRSALLGAIRDVERIGLRVEHVEPDDYVSQAEIARRSDKSREYIRQLVSGESGPGGFPPPVCNVTDRSPRWRWTDVAKWLAQQGMLRDEEELERASIIASVNAWLDWRRLAHITSADDIGTFLLYPQGWTLAPRIREPAVEGYSSSSYSSSSSMLIPEEELRRFAWPSVTGDGSVSTEKQAQFEAA